MTAPLALDLRHGDCSMTKPLALDLFSCGGGSTTGLQRAGFRVVGADHKRQKEYRGDDFIEADLSTADAILEIVERVRPDFISSSPPCQRYAIGTPAARRHEHPDLIPATREAIVKSGLPGWVENVAGAPLRHAIMLCGTMFPETTRLQRHRYFELLGWFTMEPLHAGCHGRDVVCVSGENGVSGKRGPDGTRLWRHNSPGPECVNWREAMGWLDGPRSRYCLAQAVPPAYAEFLARAFLARRK